MTTGAFVANPGAGGDTFAADLVSGEKVPYSKLAVGGTGALVEVSTANPLPVGVQGTVPVSSADLTALAGTITTHDTVAPATPAGQLMMAVRRDADNSPVGADGDFTYLTTNEVGRLKVAGAAAQFTPVVGNIVAVAGTVQADVTQVSNVMFYCTGTFAGSNCTFEGSIDNGASWFGIQAVRSNANTIETTTGVLGAAPAYAWETSVNALTNVRVRATAFTSGTQVWRFTLGAYATEPIPAAQVSGTQPVSGTVTANIGTGSLAAGTNAIGDVGIQYRANAAGAATTFKFASAATVNNALILTGARRLLGWSLTNTTAAFKYFRFYNLATAPASGASPTFMVGIPPNSTVISPPVVGGIAMSLGLGIACTNGVADTDATVTAVNDVIGEVFYA